MVFEEQLRFGEDPVRADENDRSHG
jgi:hypothetical protein